MSKLESILNLIRQIGARLALALGLRRSTSSNKRHTPELWELEAKLTKEPDVDPERLMDRQLSATHRSGRG